LQIIEQQNRQIEELNRRLEEVEKSGEATEMKAEEAVEKATQAQESTSDATFKWGPAPTIMSKDGNWSFKVRGRLFVDGGALGDDDDFYKDDNATELRAARLGVEGKVYKDFEYKFETDFANDEATVKDAYVEWDAEDFPVYLRVGQFKTPNSLEEQTSSRFITFMERAAITDAFDLNRRIGLGVGGDVAGFGYDLGIFGQEVGDAQNNEGYALAGRGYYDWFYGDDEDKSKLLHFGASARYRNFDNDVDDSEVRYRQRPFFHFTGTRSVDTGTIADADSDTFVGGEFAWVSGPFSLQGEAANTWTQLDGNSDLDNLWGGYVGASYFLTGEHRNYSASSGTFKRVKVLRPVQDGGHGAWEIGARLDYIDLNNKSAKGGEQYSTIAGVTWYLNDYIRMMLNGAVTKVEDAGPNSAADGSNNTIWGVGGRVQVDW